VKNAKHAFTVHCEEDEQDAPLSVVGRSDHICLPHGGTRRGIVYILLHDDEAAVGLLMSHFFNTSTLLCNKHIAVSVSF